MVEEEMLGEYEIFDIFPPKQYQNSIGNASYWVDVLREVVKNLIACGHAVWPVLPGTGDGPVVYEALTQSDMTLVKSIPIGQSIPHHMEKDKFPYAAVGRAKITVLGISQSIVEVLDRLENFSFREVTPSNLRSALLVSFSVPFVVPH